MRFTSTILASVILFASSDSASAQQEKGQKATLFKDDQSYWNRVLQKGYPVGSMPTNPPTERPTTSPPTASQPTDPPTFPGPCDIDIDITCSLDIDDPDGGANCDTLEEVTELQCAGCPPVTLCFTYTANPCPPADEVVPGMNSCMDFNDGPQSMADITISNGMKMFVDGTFMVGAEFCISDDGAELPEQLFVFINAPMGGMSPTPNQLSVIDSSCRGQGLTLLTAYGSLNLVHYINCNGDNDCFVPITYTHEACNEGPAGLTITDMDRVLNGVDLDLIAGVDPTDLRLEETECFTKEDPVMADCCSGKGLDISTTVIAVGDDGKICDHTETLTLTKPIETPLPTTPPTLSTPEPTQATPEPTPATPEPTPATPEPTAATPEPTAATPEPTTATPEPTTATPEPTAATPEPTASTPEPTTATPEPTAATPEPTAATPEPTAATPEPTTATPEPTTATPEPTVATLEPTVATPEPTVATTEPTAATPEPTAATPEPTAATPEPTPGPTTFPPGDDCFVQIGVTCTPPPGFSDCDSITPPRDECLDKVFTMGFRYQGGNCDRSDNIQDPQIFQCEDFMGGPPTSGDAMNHFIVSDIKGLGINYFTGDVGLGNDFVLTNGNDLLGANVNVTIYESANNISPSGILQTMVIHTSCSQVTFLKDTYGAIQLLSFNNTVQGFVSCFADITLDFSIQNVLENTGTFTAILETLISITNFDQSNGPAVSDMGILNFTDQVAGIEVAPGDSIPIPPVMLTLDLSMRKEYTLFSILQGASPDGFSCQDSNATSFIAATTIINPAPNTTGL